MKRSKGGKFSWKLVLAFLIIALVLASPFICRFLLISEAYVYTDVRPKVLHSIFLLRDSYGVTIGDLAIHDVDLDGHLLHIRIHEKYHGLLDMDDYAGDPTLNRDFNIIYDFEKDSMWVESIDVK